MKELLVVVDMQTDFVNGALGTKEAEEAVPAVEKLVKAAKHVVYTQDTHGENYFETQEGRKLPVAHCIRGTKGWEILPSLYKAGSRVFEKGAFGSVELAEYVRKEKFTKITLCGVCTDICILLTAIDAYNKGFDIVIHKDGVSSFNLDAHEVALQHFENSLGAKII